VVNFLKLSEKSLRLETKAFSSGSGRKVIDDSFPKLDDSEIVYKNKIAIGNRAIF
jgi:hypothetical protein|tara:strand:- start:149 stop:313 length:165 start_codon:yes stop_codon:yes gene_type:complete